MSILFVDNNSYTYKDILKMQEVIRKLHEYFQFYLH